MHTQANGRERWVAGEVALLVARAAAWARRLAHALVQRREALRQRRALLELDDHLLKDIGLRRVDAVREADRLLWQDALGLPLERLPRPSREAKKQPPGRTRELPE
jgi:uncharacterized protein YjiS (DUF1127 family)